MREAVSESRVFSREQMGTSSWLCSVFSAFRYSKEASEAYNFVVLAWTFEYSYSYNNNQSCSVTLSLFMTSLKECIAKRRKRIRALQLLTRYRL